MENNNLLTIKNLHTSFRIDGSYYNAVDGVSLDVHPNELLAIVGESGCGKSTVAMSVMGLHDMRYTRVSGEIIFGGKNLLSLSEAEMNTIRGKEIGFIFQDPLASLNPLQRVGKQIEEALLYHTDLNEKERTARVIELLQDVGIQNPERTAQRFPHELSGGMRQRVLIATALSCNPSLIIADEPTTALDVTIQAQILDLIKDLQEKHRAGIILITHDLGVVAQVADRVAVMYAGQIVELAPAEELFTNPLHPYTRSLLKSIPQTDNDDDTLHVIKGMVPSLKNLKHTGCRFANRITWIAEDAHEAEPVLHEVHPGHFVRCSCWKHFRFEDEA
ncbi:MAG: ABC transporter ATP-binding protein [Treponema sp.]